MSTAILTPKTITLYGRGPRRYPVVPSVWTHCVKEARRLKRWAATVKNDRKWLAGACEVSREHLAHTLATSVTDLATKSYRYLEMRAHLGNPECWDRPARALWIKLGGRIPPAAEPRKPV